MQSIKTPRNVPQDLATPAPANPVAPDHGRRVTKEEYWAKWYENPYPNLDVSYEWNNGILRAKPPSNYPQINQYRWFFTLISLYVQTHPIAELINQNTGVSMTVPDAAQPSGKWDVVYKPDLGVIRHDNPAPWGAIDQYAYEGVCDICVEEISDATLEEVRRDTQEKKRGYALAGVKEYFILDPADRYMRFYRLTPDQRYQDIQPAAGIISSRVLPGFQFRRQDLLDLPDLTDLALDETYAAYVIPGFRDAVTRLEQAVDRAAAATAARRQAEEKLQALPAELSRLRQQRP